MQRELVIRCWLAGILAGNCCASPIEQLKASSPITALALTPDGQHVAVGSTAGIEIRSLPELTVTGTVKSDLEHVHDLVFTPDGQTMLAAGGTPGSEGVVEFWNWPTFQRPNRIATHEDVVYRVAVSPDGSGWATASGDGYCHLYDMHKSEPSMRYAGHSRAVLAIAYFADGKTLVSASVDRTLQWWDAVTGKTLRSLENHQGSVNDLAVCPHVAANGIPIVATVGEDQTARFWQPTVGRMMRFARLESIPRAVVWSMSGDRIVVGCNDGQLRVVHRDTAKVVHQQSTSVGRIHAMLWIPKGQKMLVAGEKGLSLAKIDESLFAPEK